MKQRCTRCGVYVERQGSETTFWCTCGHHWTHHHAGNLPPTARAIVVDIPEVKKVSEKAPRGKNRRNTSIMKIETRSEWLQRHKITEAEVFTEVIENEEVEYFLQDNFYAGTTQKVYIPKRFKVKNRYG